MLYFICYYILLCYICFEAVNENEDYILNGARGVVSFQTYSIKSDRQKAIHINLYTRQMIEYYDNIKRTLSCDDIYSINRPNDNNCLIELQLQKSMGRKTKKIIFASDTMAHRFHQYIEFLHDSGKQVKESFHQIDYRNTSVISGTDLSRALARIDLKASDEDIHNMLMLSSDPNGLFDYHDFFHLLVHSFVANLHDCLQEWLIIATSKALDASTNLSKIDTSLNHLPGIDCCLLV